MLKRKTNIFLSIGALALVTLACNTLLPLPAQTSAPTQSIELIPTALQDDLPQTADEVPRVDVNLAKAAFDSGQAIIVDVRSPEAYATSHAAGAISIPLDEFENNIASVDLDKAQWIITYCT